MVVVQYLKIFSNIIGYFKEILVMWKGEKVNASFHIKMKKLQDSVKFNIKQLKLF